MAFSNFIPEIWFARLLDHMDKVHVYANLLNRDYEGDIKAYGDTVHINLLGDITISSYTGSDLGTPQQLDSTQQNLVIDQAKYFNFIVKDIDNAQSNPKLVDAAMIRARYNMNDVIDQYLAGLLVSGAAEDNILYGDDAPIVPTSSTAYDLLVGMSIALSEANAPMYGRWVVVPPWFHGLLLKDSRFVGNGTGFNQAMLQGGLVGEAAGFQIHLSNNVPNTSGAKYKLMAGTAAAGAYAEQLVELEAYRVENNFCDGVKGLHIYGAKVLHSTGLVIATADKNAAPDENGGGGNNGDNGEGGGTT